MFKVFFLTFRTNYSLLYLPIKNITISRSLTFMNYLSNVEKIIYAFDVDLLPLSNVAKSLPDSSSGQANIQGINRLFPPWLRTKPLTSNTQLIFSPLLKNSCLLILFCCFFLSAQGQALDDQIQFKVYGFEEGLSHRNTFKVTQDSAGYIWVASISGLNRFDSKTFLKYNFNSTDPRIPNDYVSDMCVESDSILWLSLPGQIVRLNTNSGYYSILPIDHSTATEKEDASLSGLYVDRKNNLWSFAYSNETGSSVLHKANSEIGVIDVMDCKGTFAKRAIIEMGGYLFFSYDENMLLEIDRKGEEVNSFVLGDKNDPASRAWVTQMQVTKDRTLWALMSNGQVYFIKKGSRDFELHPMSNALANQGVFSTFHVNDNGNIWVGGMGHLWLYYATSKRTVDYNEDIKDITKHTVNYRHIYKDQTGVVWIASDFGLIKCINSNSLFTAIMADGNEYCHDASCSMRGITGDDKGNIYFSYYNSIHVLNPRTNSLGPLFPVNDFYNPPFGILYYKDAIWTGNGRRIDLNTLEVDTILQMPSTDLGDVMVDGQELVWFGFRNRIAIYDTRAKILTDFKDLSGIIDTQKVDISYIYQCKNQDHVWLGTLGHGLYKIDKLSGTLAHYHTENKNGPTLLHNKVNGVYEDKNGNLWIATGNGLHKLHIETEKMSVYFGNHGLTNNFINGLLSEGDSVIWVSTDLGLSRFSIADERFTNFTKEDGLSGNEFNRISFYQSDDGTMYFGGLHGVNAFKPGPHFLRKKEQLEGKILLTSFSKLDGDLDSLINYKTGIGDGQKMTLSWRDKFFTFEFALANYIKPGSHMYSYKLDGYERDWSEASSINTARYNIVPHGNYTFRVRARSGNSYWNSKELAIPIYVQQAFYKSWWFIGLAGMSLIGILIGLSQYSLYQARKRELLLKKEVRARTLDLEKEMKKSDELLLNILPAEIAEELKKYGKAKAKRHESVTVFFSDFKGFTLISQQLEPEELVNEIDHCFREFDKIMEKYGMEKIKTIGDAYMCAGGIPTPLENSAINMIKAALEIQEFMKQLAIDKTAKNEPYFETRIGIHTGPLVSGIVGIKKFAYDIWGDTVNIAARLEDNGVVGKVNISQSTYELVKDNFDCTHRGKVTIKHEEAMDMYFVKDRV